jgi:hypothetical protein
VGTAVVTMKRVFPEVAIWETARGDLLLVAQRKHVPIDVERLRTLLAQEPYSSAARLVWRTSSPEGVLAHHVASSKLADAIVERQLGTVNTDDQNLLEFAFARSVGERRRVDVEVNELALRLRMSEADLSTPVDWRQVIEERWLMQESGSTERLVPPPSSRPDIPLGRVIELHRDGDCAGVLRVWKRLGRKPRSSGEGALLAECAARAGTEDDAHLMESGLAHERALIDAIWRGRHGDVEGTIESLFRGFTELQTVPWPRLSLSRAALARAVDLSAKDPRIARIFYDVLKKPFAVEALREERLIAALRTAASTGDAALCVEALAPLEPPPLEKRTLEQRLQCYTTANHPLRGAAEKDLTELMAHETAFGASIASPPRPPHAPKVDPIEPADTIPEAPLVEADAGPSDAGPSDAGAGARDAAPRDAQP